MSRWLERAAQSEVRQGFCMVPIAMAGVALPFGFASQVDAYVKSMAPMEIAALYAFGWIMFALSGIALALLAAGIVWPTARLWRGRPAAWVGRTCVWLALVIMALSVVSAAQSWLRPNDAELADVVSRFKLELGFAIAVGCALWTWRYRSVPESVSSLASFAALAGFLAVLIALPLNAQATKLDKSPAIKSLDLGAPAPNIVLLTIDALAADHLSLYGYPRPTAPHLEDLAATAHVFERFYANSNYTTPSINSILRGVRPWSHGANQIYARVDYEHADRNLITALKEAGYETMAVATNELAAPSHVRIDRSLDKVAYRRIKSWLPIPQSVAISPHVLGVLEIGIAKHLMQELDSVAFYLGFYRGADHYNPDFALSSGKAFLIGRNRSQPFFLWIHLYPPHAPYAAPAPFMGRFDSGPQARTTFNSTPLSQFLAQTDPSFPDRYTGRYDESVLYVDHHLGRFIEWLKANRLFDNSLLIVTADHGESFRRGYGGHGGPILREDLIRIPLLMKEPGQTSGSRLRTVSEQVDLVPTILDIAGIATPWTVEGRSLKSVMRGMERRDSAVFSMNFEQSSRGRVDSGSVAIIEKRWKYIHYRGHLRYPMLPKLQDELYDLETDESESNNLVAAQPRVAAEMLARVRSALSEHGGNGN